MNDPLPPIRPAHQHTPKIDAASVAVDARPRARTTTTPAFANQERRDAGQGIIAPTPIERIPLRCLRSRQIVSAGLQIDDEWNRAVVGADRQAKVARYDDVEPDGYVAAAAVDVLVRARFLVPPDAGADMDKKGAGPIDLDQVGVLDWQRNGGRVVAWCDDEALDDRLESLSGAGGQGMAAAMGDTPKGRHSKAEGGGCCHLYEASALHSGVTIGAASGSVL